MGQWISFCHRSSKNMWYNSSTNYLLVIEYQSIKYRSCLRNNHPAFITSNKNPYVKETDHIEINALFGLMYLRGLCGMNLQRVDYLFADEGHYAFGAIMSKNRFKFLLSHITFDNHIDCENNWPTDRFATMRPVWELLNSNLGKYVASSEYLTTNETLCPVQHQIAFRQCNPNKPHKYGVLLKLLNDARFPNPYKAYHMQLNQLLVMDPFT